MFAISIDVLESLSCHNFSELSWLRLFDYVGIVSEDVFDFFGFRFQ